MILFYGFYCILLRTETFFKLNRGYLVVSAALAFFIPLMQSEWVRSWFVTEQISQTITTFYDPQVLYLKTSKQAYSLSIGDFIAIFYITGILIGIARFGGNLVYLGKMMKRKIVQKESKQAFSFFNVLFVSKELKNRSTIMKHEFVHIRQLHSADVLLFELIVIFNWFNPVVYLYKSSIKHIHEFIADEVASRNETSKADYAMLLFQEQFSVQAIPLTNNFFNQSLLKLRIKMLNKQRSTQTAMIKYGFIAPLFTIMIVISSATLASKELAKIEAKVEEISDKDLAKVIEKPSETVTETLLKDNIDLSKAFIISPDLVDEVKAISKNTRDTNQVFDAVEENPEFVGGMEGLGKFLQENLKYPEAAKKANYSGKVYTSFIVNTDGTTTNFEVLKSGEFGFNEEALRVLKLVPKWIPGKSKGKNVRSRFIVPINFALEEEKISTSVFAIPDNGKFEMKDKSKMKFEEPKNYIYYLDDNEITQDDIKKLDINLIESMSIFKGDKAVEKYGEKCRNGVMVITSKKK